MRWLEVQVVHADFTSEYPRINALLGNWDVLTAERVRSMTRRSTCSGSWHPSRRPISQSSDAGRRFDLDNRPNEHRYSGGECVRPELHTRFCGRAAFLDQPSELRNRSLAHEARVAVAFEAAGEVHLQSPSFESGYAMCSTRRSIDLT